jgi:hypothetical protein
MSCKELLERKKALLESIEAEEVARKALLRAVNGLIEDAGEGSINTADAMTADCVHSLGDIMSGLLKKKHGAQHYDSQLYLACQNAQDALNKIAGGASTVAAAAQAAAAAESGPSRSDGVGSSSSSSSSSSSNSNSNSNSNNNGSSNSNTNNNNAGAPKKLSSTALGLLKFEQLVKLLKENEEADHDENLVVLLTRMQALRTGLTAEKVKEHGAGKLVSKLTKHRMREVRDRAEATIRAWKEALMQPEERSKEKEKDKGKDKDKGKAQGAGGADKGSKPDKNSKSDSSRNERHASKPDKDKERKAERSPSKSGKEGTKEREAGSKRPRSGDSDSSGGDGNDMDKWMKQRKKELAAQYARVEEEEEVSRIVGETEDDLAELEEIRAAKRRLQHK